MGARNMPVVAVDMGGTKIAAALVSNSGKILHRERALTLAAAGPSAVMERLFGVIGTVLDQTNLKPTDIGGICIAAAGPIDMSKGMITNAPNLPGWDAIPLREIIKDRFKVDSYLLNDAKAAAVGEHEFGAGKGIDNLLCVTLGTGIGGGIIISGRLYLGQSGAAGEVGHMTIDVNGPRCVCGNVGCWELFASGTAMEREAAKRLNSGELSSLQPLFKGAAGTVKAEQIAEAAQNGDSLASSVIEWSANYLGTGLVSLVNIFNPEMIVMGGGLSKIGDRLLQPAINLVRQRAFPLLAQAVRILPSTIDDDAAVLGAAAFAFSKGKV